jgi:NMD protein affecting ribosome stability and mRNA decay
MAWSGTMGFWLLQWFWHNLGKVFQFEHCVSCLELAKDGSWVEDSQLHELVV